MTFPTGVIEIRKCSDEELKTMFDEARETSKHSRKLGRVMGIVAAHRLKKMRELLAYQELATWRRMNGFDRVADGEDNWFHGLRSLPPTPEKFAADLWCEVNALKDAISMSSQKVRNLINEIEQGKASDEEFAILKRLVEKRGREAAQVVDPVQHSSPYPLDPEPSPDVCVNLEHNEGRMDPELEELESPSAGTGLKTPGQQCPPNEGIWETGRTTASGILTAGAGSSKKGNISSTTERATSTRTTADISSTAATPSKRRHKTFNEHNKQFDPGGRREKAPPWNAAVTLLSFSGENWEASCLCFVFSVSALCVLCFLKLFFFSR